MVTKLISGVFIIFLISVSVISIAESVDNPEGGNQEENTEQTEQSIQLDPIPVERPIQPESQNRTAKNKKAGDQSKGYSEADLAQQTRMADSAEKEVKLADRQLIATYFSIVLTLLAVGAAIWAALVASKAANSAQASVAVASDTAKRQLRAYLVVGACSFEELPTGEGFIISAHISNCGNTPAFNARIMGEAFSSPYPLTEERPHPMPEEGFGSAVGAGKEIIGAYRLFADDPQNALEQIKSGELGVWIQGTVLYDDCFGEQHYLKFRHVFGGRLVKSGGILLHADKEGNEAD